MKQKIEKLVNELACKDLTMGCEVKIERAGCDFSKNIEEASMTEASMPCGVCIYMKPNHFIDGFLGQVYLEDDEYEIIKIIGHPITLQTVLMRPEISNKILIETDVLHTILHLWKKCGDKSLQEIISCGYADGFTQEEDELFKDMKDEDKNWMKMPVLKNKDAQNLVDYLLTIFNGSGTDNNLKKLKNEN